MSNTELDNEDWTELEYESPGNTDDQHNDVNIEEDTASQEAEFYEDEPDDDGDNLPALIESNPSSSPEYRLHPNDHDWLVKVPYLS